MQDWTSVNQLERFMLGWLNSLDNMGGVIDDTYQRVVAPLQEERLDRIKKLRFAKASIGRYSEGRGRAIRLGDQFQFASGDLHRLVSNSYEFGATGFSLDISGIEYAKWQEDILRRRAERPELGDGLPDGEGILVPETEYADDFYEAIGTEAVRRFFEEGF